MPEASQQPPAVRSGGAVVQTQAVAPARLLLAVRPYGYEETRNATVIADEKSPTSSCAPRARSMPGAGLRRRGQAALPDGRAKPANAFSLRLLSREAGCLATPRSVSPDCWLARKE